MCNILLTRMSFTHAFTHALFLRSAETIAIISVQAIMALLCMTKTKHTLFDACFIFMLYPSSLVLVYVLENHFGLD
jgi:hypothetical protein